MTRSCACKPVNGGTELPQVEEAAQDQLCEFEFNLTVPHE